MKVTETHIETIIESYDGNDEAYVRDLSQLMDQHPVLLAFIDQESTEILLPHEKDLLWFGIFIMIRAFKKASGIDIQFSEDRLSEIEEQTWETYQQQKGSFNSHLDIFFQQTEEEDLLAFIEDLLSDDEDPNLSTVGRDVLFVSMYTVLDVMVRSAKR